MDDGDLALAVHVNDDDLKKLRGEYKELLRSFGPETAAAAGQAQRVIQEYTQTMVAGEASKRRALEQTLNEYRQLARTAVKGSQEEAAANKLAGQTARQLGLEVETAGRRVSVFGREIRLAEHDASRTFRGALAGSGIFSGLGRSIAFASGTFLGGYGLAAGFRAVYDEMNNSIAVGAQTNAVIKSTGAIAGVTADHVDRLAKAELRKTGIDDEAVKSGENLLLTFTKVRNVAGAPIFDRATKDTLDLSRALREDASSAALQLGKALQDPIRGVLALRRAGISFTQDQRDQIKHLVETNHMLDAQKIILRELERQVGGSAEAWGRTLPGAVSKFHESLLNIGADLAQNLEPDLLHLTDAAQAWIDHMAKTGQLQHDVKVLAGDVKELAQFSLALAKDANDVAQAFGGWKVVIEGIIALKVAKTIGAVGIEAANLLTTLHKLQKIGPIKIPVSLVGLPLWALADLAAILASKGDQGAGGPGDPNLGKYPGSKYPLLDTISHDFSFPGDITNPKLRAKTIAEYSAYRKGAITAAQIETWLGAHPAIFGPGMTQNPAGGLRPTPPKGGYSRTSGRSFGQGALAQLWIGAGGSADIADVMAAISMAESGGRTNAIGGPNSNGTFDYGLWQINSSHGYPVDALMEPTYNAQAAVSIYGSQGLAAWSTYNNGAYKKFLKGTGANKGGGAAPPEGDTPKPKPPKPFKLPAGIRLALAQGQEAVAAAKLTGGSADDRAAAAQLRAALKQELGYLRGALTGATGEKAISITDTITGALGELAGLDGKQGKLLSEEDLAKFRGEIAYVAKRIGDVIPDVWQTDLKRRLGRAESVLQKVLKDGLVTEKEGKELAAAATAVMDRFKLAIDLGPEITKAEGQAKTMSEILAGIPNSVLVDVTDEWGRVIEELNPAQIGERVRQAFADLSSAGSAGDAKKALEEIAAASDLVKASFSDWQDQVKRHVDELKQAAQDAGNAFQTGFAGGVQKGMQAFDAITADHIAHMKVLVQSAFGDFMYGEGDLTPAERQRQALVASHNAAESAKALKAAQDRLDKANARVTRYDAAGFAHGSNAYKAALQEQADAQKEVDDLNYQAKLDALDQQAQLEKTAAQERLDQARRDYQADRDLQKEHLSKKLADLQENLLKGNETADQARLDLAAIWAEFGVDAAAAGALIGASFVISFNESIAGLWDTLNKLKAAQAEVGIGDGSPIKTPRPGSGAAGLFEPGGAFFQPGGSALAPAAGGNVVVQGDLVVSSPSDAELVAGSLARRLATRRG